jgi:hypothetical protein
VGVVAATICVPPGIVHPEAVTYQQFPSNVEMNARFEKLVANTPRTGTCDGTGLRGTYPHTGTPHGLWACYHSNSNDNRVVWTDNTFHTLGIASDRTMSAVQVHDWWWQADVVLE